MDRRNRGMPMKRRMIGGPAMKNKRSEDEEKVCQYFLQGKCLKVKFVRIIHSNYEFFYFTVNTLFYRKIIVRILINNRTVAKWNCASFI